MRINSSETVMQRRGLENYSNVFDFSNQVELWYLSDGLWYFWLTLTHAPPKIKKSVEIKQARGNWLGEYVSTQGYEASYVILRGE